MKKVFMTLMAVAAIAMCFTSCKKNNNDPDQPGGKSDDTKKELAYVDISADNVYPEINQTSTLTGTLVDKKSVPLPGRTLNLYCDDKQVSSQKTNDEGKVMFEVTSNEVVSKDYYFTFDGDDKYKSAKSYPQRIFFMKPARRSTSITVSVSDENPAVGDFVVVTVTLKDKENGTPLGGKKIKLSDVTNMRFYDGMTDNAGKWYLDFEIRYAQETQLSADYDGDGDYYGTAGYTKLVSHAKEEEEFVIEDW